VDGLLEDRAETGHRHEIDVMTLQGVDDPVGVRDPIEVGAEALPLHDLGRDPGPLGGLDRGAGPVHDHDDDGEISGQQGIEDGPLP
jgi:hypothetical protein